MSDTELDNVLSKHMLSEFYERLKNVLYYLPTPIDYDGKPLTGLQPVVRPEKNANKFRKKKAQTNNKVVQSMEYY